MLQKHITDFLSYCKVVGFSAKSRESLTVSLRDFSLLCQCAIGASGWRNHLCDAG